MLINTASAAFFASGLFTTYRRQFWPMVCFANVALLLKLWYVVRMTFYYAQHSEREEEPAEDVGAIPASPVP